MKHCIILADGEFPRRPQLLEMLGNAACVVCCDGAADKLLAFGREPDWIVGDLDSVSPDTKARFADRAVKFFEQETNDLAKSFRFCQERGIAVSAILGAAGAREDHFLGNLGQFAEVAAKFPGIRLYTDSGYFSCFSGAGEFEAVPGSQVSIFSFDPAAKLNSSGLKYPLVNLALSWWYSGTLNEVISSPFTLCSDRETPILLFFKYHDLN
ncbi:MAG: thiamine diphosphokinase [Lentisphaerae bacterium]|nr:thiamine diphosphokinase [Lentisphaerota bacterium]